MVASCFEALSDDLILHVLSFADARTLARAGAANQCFRGCSRHEELWATMCAHEGIGRDGSSRPGARTYCSWFDSWLNARCAECSATYKYKVALDGGSSSACTWRGAKVALCGGCAKRASQHPTAEAWRRLPRLCASYGAEGAMVAIICGRNMQAVFESRQSSRFRSKT